MAPYYEAFTASHDTGLWLKQILGAIAQAGGASPGGILEVGCGTGKNFSLLLERGWRITGLDISPAMLAEAKARFGTVDLVEGDIADLPRLGSFEVVACLDDGLNYLLSEAALVSALSGMADNCGQQGLVVFDVNTLLTYRTFFAERFEVESQGASLIWRGLTSPVVEPGRVCRAEFVARPHDRRSQQVQVEHRQRHFPLETVTGAIAAAGLELVSVCGHDRQTRFEQPADELRHIKAVFVARPKQAR